MEGHVDAVRFTMGIEEYNATTGSFSEPTAAHDTVDAGESASYAYPLSVNLFNPTAETSSSYPWVNERGLERGMNAILDSAGGPTPRTIANYCFCPSDLNLAQNAANFIASINYLDVDMTRYDAQFLDDIDANILEVDFSGWALLENAGDGHGTLDVEFLNSDGSEILGMAPGDFHIPASANTWEQASTVARIPASTRTIRFRVRTSKDTNAFVDQRYFWCDFTASIDRITGYLTDAHNPTYYADTTKMVSDWNSANTTLVEQDVFSSTQKYTGLYCYDNTAVGTNVDCDSGLINLASDTTDIDAGSVDFELSAMMANDVDSCALWIEFYEADGTTIVGTRFSSAETTRNARGQRVTVTGTIGVGAEKALIGFRTDTGASGSDFHGNYVQLFEVGPPASAGGGGGGGGTAMAIMLGINMGGD